MTIRKLALGIAAGCLAITAASVAPPSVAAGPAAGRLNRPLPAAISELRLAEPLTAQGVEFQRGRIDAALKRAKGRQQVLVRLRSPSAAEITAYGPADRVGHREKLRNEQSAFVRRAASLAPGSKMKTSVQTVLNAVVMDVDADQIRALASDPDVARISRVVDYRMDLSETVPYITASMVQSAGFDGSGVKVAVLDSGIDYFHAAFGGSGNPADYAANDPAFIETGTFPTAKVTGGYDFVGSDWPNTPEVSDPDPLDDGPGAGHGTHVAHIIGGIGGVAPGVDLYAVKVCSSVSTSCSGVALIQGMEFAVDPNGDGDPSDHVDIINMSLGSVYGQAFDDDLALAVNNATALGVLTVASAGNSSDKPYVTGTPSAALTALSVAQTEMPSANLQFITVGANNYPALFQPWSTPLAGTISAPVQYGNGALGNRNGCAAFTAGSLAGLIVLVDRGTCNFTLKIKNIGAAGGLAGIIGLVAPGAPFSGGDGGDRPIGISGYMISQADSSAIKAALGSNTVIAPNNVLPLVMTMVGSSSRGPRNPDSLIKPEIGAPGASVSAIAGTGTGTGPFGGTSGAAPMVTGSAALLLDAYPQLSPAEVKARLMNNGYTDIETDPFTGLAPITRIGGGEVRVYNALMAPAAAWDDETRTGALSFGFDDVSKNVVTLQRKVRVRNYSGKSVTYDIKPTFRFADDIVNGAVSVSAPPKIRVGPKKDATFPVEMTIRGDLLRGNFMNSGSDGANPAGLTLNEYDGYLSLDDGKNPIHLAWHILPRKAADVAVPKKTKFIEGGITGVKLDNKGVGTAQNDAYALLAVSPNLPEGLEGGTAPTPDLRAVGVNTFPVPAGFCSGSDSFIWVFALNTWERQSHLVPVVHNVYLDVNQDGTDDYVVFNFDVSFSGAVSDGRQLTWAVNLTTGSASAFFFAEHATNTGNTVLYICGEQIGMNASNFFQQVNAVVVTEDFYFGGPGDLVEGLTIAPLGERYLGIPVDLAGKTKGSMDIIDFGALPGNSDELGVMLLTNGDRGTGARGGATQCTEALLICAEGKKSCSSKEDSPKHDDKHGRGDDKGNRNGC